MQRQAHDAMSKLNAHDKTHPGFTELDRIGGKTQLIASTAVVSAPSPSSSSSASTPDSSYTGTGTTSTSSVGSSMYDLPSNDPGNVNGAGIHPILVNDMRTFGGFPTNSAGTAAAVPMDFDFDLSQAFPLPLPTGDFAQSTEFQTQNTPDMSGFVGFDFFGGTAGDVNTMPANNNVMLQDPSFDDIPNSMGGMSVPVPELHATWQSFVEQLGFKF